MPLFDIPFVGDALGLARDTVGGLTGSTAAAEAAREAQLAAMREGRAAIDQGRQSGLNAIGQGVSGAQGYYDQARGALGAGYGDAMGALGGGYADAYRGLAAGYGAGQDALRGARSDLLSGIGAAQGYLNPYIQQDMGARGAYMDRLMGGGDDPYWQRLSDRRHAALGSRLAAQGLSGSSAAAHAMANSEMDLQNMREQQFYDRARGLFNDSAAHAAGLAQQGGMGLAGIGAQSAGMHQAYGNQLGAMGTSYGQGLAGLHQGLGAGLAGILGAQGGTALQGGMSAAQLEQAMANANAGIVNQGHQGLGQIGANAAMAPWQNMMGLLGLGGTVAGAYYGAGGGRGP